MKINLIVLISIFFFVSCQSSPTRIDPINGGPEHGFLPPPVFNSSMQNLKTEMISLQHYIFDKNQFENPENKEFLQKEIHKLAVDSKNVRHDPILLTKDPTVRFVAIQFADEIQKADENFKAGWYEYSRWQLVKTTSYCLECHTRMRDGVSFNPPQTTRQYLTNLPVTAQIEFMIAFRQFEPAFKLALASLKRTRSELVQSIDAERIARLGLLVAVQFMQDPEKARQIVRVIDKNSSLPLDLKLSNKKWKDSLDDWNPNEFLNEVPKVRELIRGRKSEIEDMRAIPALLRMITEGLNREEMGETLYLAGQSYESLNKISLLSLHENYYEYCVRRSAHTKWGAICYQKLADSITADYSESGGARVPRNLKMKLEELKKEIERE